jgi:hypothetical protein
MSKTTHVMTRQLDDFIAVINTWYRKSKEAGETIENFDIVKRDRDRWIAQLHGVYKPSARPYAGQVLAQIAYDLLYYRNTA